MKHGLKNGVHVRREPSKHSRKPEINVTNNTQRGHQIACCAYDPAAEGDAERKTITVKELTERFDKKHIWLGVKETTFDLSP